MGFVKDVARAATFGAVGSSLLKNKKKKPDDPLVRPTMISTTSYERPISMIKRGG